jgi:hypothetical protein
MAGVTEMNLSKMDERSTMMIDVNFTKMFYVRFWIMQKLLRLAARVMGCGIEVRVKNE